MASTSICWAAKIDGCREQFNAIQKPCTLLITNRWDEGLKMDKQTCQFPGSFEKLSSRGNHSHAPRLHAALRSPKGFGPSPKKTKKTKKPNREYDSDEDEDEDDEDNDQEDARDQGVIPEVVTNRMMNRMAISVGAPLFIGLLFFPFFYYLKVGLKIDVPTWVPFIVSFFFFGSALLGVSYGIVSSSWDPLREGSLLGWNEAQKNWPVFWQSLWGGRSGKK
ncbi:protein PAM68, chloroplastic isoform X2 [Rhodamnia argentea]|uniref:Protein PAM68, chloroplastic isoform X2 n=1 Tax=Rhodamnia argentea TaxID=178133 RepID=A0A8B8PKV4_9MYRT|nr:protein PAM68, chloroplastic isoform X2 [Rhodamnia argentea]